MKWNAGLYDSKHSFVSANGEALIDLLDPKPGESILDVGCGTGDLAAMINAKGARVTGMDSSPEMIEAAEKKYPGMRFKTASAAEFSFEEPFDAIFSNATLHWFLEYREAASRMFNALRPGGRLVAEMGGKGNVSGIIGALKETLNHYGYHTQAEAAPWYFPSVAEYATVLERAGFRVVFAAHFDRPTALKDKSGLHNWLRMFGEAFLQGIHPDHLQTILSGVEQRMAPGFYRDGTWYADYVRLRIIAIKE